MDLNYILKIIGAIILGYAVILFSMWLFKNRNTDNNATKKS